MQKEEAQAIPTCFTQQFAEEEESEKCIISLEDAQGNLVDFDMLDDERLFWLDQGGTTNPSPLAAQLRSMPPS